VLGSIDGELVGLLSGDVEGKGVGLAEGRTVGMLPLANLRKLEEETDELLVLKIVGSAEGEAVG